jgi:hypothetical protein
MTDFNILMPLLPHVYQVGEQINLLHPIGDIVVTFRKDLGMDNIMHNMKQLEGFYVVIKEIFDGNVLLWFQNMNNDPPQEFIEDAKGTTIVWRWDHMRVKEG